MSKSRLVERQNALTAVYIHLIRDQAVEEVIEDNQFVTNVSEFLPRFYLSEEMVEVVKRACGRKEVYGLAMNQFLNKWRFDRLSYIEQAILLVACSELELGVQDKVIIVNEAVRLAKDYAAEDSYKFINGVLDAI